ncbi:MAG: leucine-rich repeat domain-containing protein [Oscillospiraceae bacterium]|nr:leucine-rich repeat domain-containing protein [Oscillospiraceae bacterium]
MTVAEMIAQRTAKLTAIKDSSNAAVTAKGGTAADDLSGLPAAIESITSGGGALPVLINPAAAGDVIAGKEYIDASGTKNAGTLVVCDTITEVEFFGRAGTGVSLDIESTADGSGKNMMLRETNLLPENIKSGISIFGIQGSLVGGGAKEPYIEETYDADGKLIDVNLVGYTTIRNNAFQNCIKLTLTSLPGSITSIEANAFQNCASLALTSLPGGLTSIGNYAFYRCSKLALVSLPSGVTSIGNYAFTNCAKITLTSLPSGLKRIEASTFDGCTNLALTSLPSGITNIGANAFYKCTGLTSITFKGKPSSIASSAFNGCTNLKTINVPWASGEVADAPWGATNATINYNYTG